MTDLGFIRDKGAHVRLWFENGDWVAEIPAWPTCMAEGSTPEEALANLEALAPEWHDGSVAAGAHIPPPGFSEDSGRIALRISGHMHTWLKEAAERDEVTLNHYIATSLHAVLGGRLVSETLGNEVHRWADDIRYLESQFGQVEATSKTQPEALRFGTAA